MNKAETKAKWRERHQRLKSDPKYIERKNNWGKRLKLKPLARLCHTSNNWYKNGRVTPFDLWKIAKKQKLLCPLTGEKLTNENVSIDHIISKSKGGLNIPSNIRLVLKSINVARQTMTDEEFIELCQKVVRHSNSSSVH